MVFRELSFSRLECGVHDRLHIYPLCGVFYFPWHRHPIEGTNGFYCLIRNTERFTISNVESQVFTPTNSRLPRGLNAGGPRPKRVSYHWTTAPLSLVSTNSVLKLLVLLNHQSHTAQRESHPSDGGGVYCQSPCANLSVSTVCATLTQGHCHCENWAWLRCH